MKRIIKLFYTAVFCFAVMSVATGCFKGNGVNTGIISDHEYNDIVVTEEALTAIFDNVSVTDAPSNSTAQSAKTNDSGSDVSAESNNDNVAVSDSEIVVVSDDIPVSDGVSVVITQGSLQKDNIDSGNVTSGAFAKGNITSSNDNNSIIYILNTNTYKFHYESCGSAKQIKESNKDTATDRDSIIARGFSPCKRCNP